MYVSFIESNVKGGVRCALGEKTLVVGPNGSGKSTIVNSVELALTGRVSDISGRREVAKEIDLMALAPGRTGELAARAVLASAEADLHGTDLGEAIWRAGGKGGKKAKHNYPPGIVDPSTALPLRPVYEAVMGNVETARKFFLQFAVGEVTDKDVLTRIPESLHAFFRRATLAAVAVSPVDRLLSALEHSKKQARDAKARAKAAEAVSTEQTQGVAPLPTEAELKALDTAIREAEARLDAAKNAAARKDALAAAVAEQADLASRLEALEKEVLTLREEQMLAQRALAEMPVPQGSHPDVLALRQVIEAHAKSGTATCQCCGHGGVILVGGVATNAKDWNARLVWIDGVLATNREAVTAYEAAKGRLATAEVKSSSSFAEGKRLFEQKKAVDAIVAGGAVAVPSPEEIAGIEASLVALRDKQRGIDALRATWATASKSKDTANDEKKAAEDWANLAAACVEAVSQLLDAGVDGFRAKVQGALPDRDRFALTLRDGERAVFQYGLLRSGVIHSALSGAEWARVTAAMAGVCHDPKKLSVVIPEERAFDPQTLHDVLLGFTTLDTQVIVTSPVAPAAVPPGWLVINTAKEEHRGGALFEQPAIPVTP